MLYARGYKRRGLKMESEKIKERKRIKKLISKMKIWKSTNEKINERLKYYNQALEELEERIDEE